MNKYLKIAVFVTLTYFPASLFSQQLSLSAEAGLGSYRMSDLKEYNDLVILNLPFDAKITDDFPPFWYYKYSIQYSFRKLISAGIILSNQSTGSRIAVSDYSGEFRKDMTLRASSGGIIIELFYPMKNLKLSFINETGVLSTHLDMFEYLKLNTESHQLEYAYKAKSYYYEPALKISYRKRFIQAGILAGYQFDFVKGDFKPIIHNYPLNLSETRKVKPDWSGFRLGASISFVLNLSKKK